jgi:Rab-GTPase-TBC domain
MRQKKIQIKILYQDQGIQHQRSKQMHSFLSKSSENPLHKHYQHTVHTSPLRINEGKPAQVSAFQTHQPKQKFASPSVVCKKLITNLFSSESNSKNSSTVKLNILKTEMDNTRIRNIKKNTALTNKLSDEPVFVRPIQTLNYLTMSNVEMKSVYYSTSKSIILMVVQNAIKYLDILDLLKLQQMSKAFNKEHSSLIKAQMRHLLASGLSTKERIIYWRKVTSIYKSKISHPNYYHKIVESLNEDKYRIAFDVTRTFPDMDYFAKNKEGYHKMLNVLRALCEDNRKVGYTQGMNFIAGLILITHGDEEVYMLTRKHFGF